MTRRSSHRGWTSWEDGPLAREHGISTRQEFVELVHRLGTTANGVFGTKLMWNELPWVTRRLRALPQLEGLSTGALLAAVFPRLHVVHIIRRDRVGQAISWAKAAQDGVWVALTDAPAPPAGQPVYDFELISNLERLVIEGEEGWRGLFGELGLHPYTVVYEDLATPEGYRAAVLGIADHLGVDRTDLGTPHPRSRRQADHVNEAWRRRYLDDLAGRSGRSSCEH